MVSGTQVIHSGFEDGNCAWTEEEEGMNEVWSPVPWECSHEKMPLLAFELRATLQGL